MTKIFVLECLQLVFFFLAFLGGDDGGDFEKFYFENITLIVLV